jgi:NitT/TauT family transport system substrate-binding protein
MKKRFLLILISTIVTAMMALSGCGNEEIKEPDNQNKTLSDTVRIVTMETGAEEAMASMPDGFSVDVFQKISDVESQILTGSYDLAIVPATTAAKLYQQTGGELVAISPVSLNGWFIVSNKGYITTQDISDLRGETIVASGQGGTGEAVLRLLLKENFINPDFGVRMKWVDTPAQVLEALNEKYTIALLQEPYASQALTLSSSSDEVTADIDLGALWETGHKYSFPSQILIANKRFVDERADDFQLFISAYEEALELKTESSTIKLVFYGRSNRGIEIIKNFMALMEENDISLLGGKSPDAAFYYGTGE